MTTTDETGVDARTEALAGLEAILFLAAEPVTVDDLSLALELGNDEVERLLAELDDRLSSASAGLTVRHVGGGWRLYTSELGREHVERFVLAGRSGRLSQAALETLAVVAYKQPITRTEIGEVRGVSADGAVRSLVARGLVTEVGRDEGPGQAVLYGTTRDFLVKLGIDRIEDLPPLAGYLIDEEAPDEPAPDHLRAARRLLQLGQRLPSTGAARWVPEDGEQPEPVEGDDEDGQPSEADEQRQAAAARLQARAVQVERRRDQEAEMADLTDQMEDAATAAMARLKDAVEAVTEDEDDEEPGDESAAVDGDPTRDAEPDAATDSTATNDTTAPTDEAG